MDHGHTIHTEAFFSLGFSGLDILLSQKKNFFFKQIYVTKLPLTKVLASPCKLIFMLPAPM
jgi:hypothetical protein